MSEAGSLNEILRDVASSASEDLSERDVENLFLEGGFYEALGYEGTGHDIRSEFSLPDDRRPDYLTLNERPVLNSILPD